MQVFPPASLAKLMTMELVFDAIDKSEITLDTEFPVSEHAWRTGGAPSGTSTMFAGLKSRVRVEDLIKGVAVQVANDSLHHSRRGHDRQRGGLCHAR